MPNSQSDLLCLTSAVTASYLGRNAVAMADIPALIQSVHGAFADLNRPKSPDAEYLPFIDPKKSVKPDYIISLIDGTRMKMLRRYLARHGMTPDEYRARYNLAPDYPMVAPNYAKRRRELAIRHGLGSPALGGGRKKAA